MAMWVGWLRGSPAGREGVWDRDPLPLQPGPGGESPRHACGFLSQTPTLCALTSLSNLSPDLASSGAKSRAPFLQYDSDSNKVKPLGFLGKEVNDTKVWTEFSQTLAEAGKELKMVLPVTKLDKKETRGKYGKGVGSWR